MLGRIPKGWWGVSDSPRRPHISIKIARGLRTVASLASADLEAGALNDGTDAENEDVEAALRYVYALCDWVEHRHRYIEAQRRVFGEATGRKVGGA